MSVERKKVLEMLADKKITAEEADRLLEKLEGSTASDSSEKPAANSGATDPKKPKHMRILVERPGREDVNIRIPMAFTRTGARLMAVLPPQILSKLAENGVDMAVLSSFNAEQLSGAMDNFQMDIEKGNGTKVKVSCE
ncbi:MAG TPA: hypothetical protein VKR82_01070 [Candidatus Acidoferrales bacterium]|nr:hypothetical protein [Candidatus Acidoferrales bacterium]